MRRALKQLAEALARTSDLDEARGEALTFVALVTAATLEMGAPREMHRIQLEAARRFEAERSVSSIGTVAQELVLRICEPIFASAEEPSAALIDHALRLVGKRYSEPISDGMIAQELGLSTSHFRHLFREVTGQPFHKYLMSLRLEKGREMLVSEGLPVTDVAVAVGFSGLAHFSRCFTERFNVTPSSARRNGLAIQHQESA